MITATVHRGHVSAALLVVLGAWGALVPFVGPYFGYAYTPDKAWTYTSGRLWLSILPGAAAALGGLLAVALPRLLGAFGGVLAAAAGAWFVIGGGVLSIALPSATPGVPATPAGAALSPATLHLLENLGFYSGLGVAIVFLAATIRGERRVNLVPASRHAAEPVDSSPSAV